MSNEWIGIMEGAEYRRSLDTGRWLRVYKLLSGEWTWCERVPAGPGFAEITLAPEPAYPTANQAMAGADRFIGEEQGAGNE